MAEPKYYPVIYVCGYAENGGDVEDTMITPHEDFNSGATKFRQNNEKKVYPWIFEPPLLRLMKDHGYEDASKNGRLLPEGPISRKSVWIFRYYDISSGELGTEKQNEIEFYAKQLRKFILHVKKAVGGDKWQEEFKVYLVACSMGDLICKCYLQNPEIPDLNGKTPGLSANKGVDKLFNYATPRGGIELSKELGWDEGLRDFDVNNSTGFGLERMMEILELDTTDDLHSLKKQTIFVR